MGLKSQWTKCYDVWGLLQNDMVAAQEMADQPGEGSIRVQWSSVSMFTYLQDFITKNPKVYTDLNFHSFSHY